MPSPNRKTLKIYVTEEENRQLNELANQSCLSLSKYLRTVSLGYEPKSKVDQQAVLAMLRVNTDLSRLGNLFKLALDQGALDERKSREMIDSIKEIKKELTEKARAI